MSASSMAFAVGPMKPDLGGLWCRCQTAINVREYFLRRKRSAAIKIAGNEGQGKPLPDAGVWGSLLGCFSPFGVAEL
jgi:hypothetical protein